MIVAIHQPQFCPWLGYFDKMRRANLFVILDDVQFEKNNWQNRNRIKTSNGATWFTVPVSFHFGQEIREVQVNNLTDWQKKYRMTLTQSYAKTAGLAGAKGFFDELFGRRWERLIELNLFTISWMARSLGISTPLRLSSELKAEGQSTDRLVDICQKSGADTYLAGAGGRNYMDLGLFEKVGVRVDFQDYEHPDYAQLHGAFVPKLSALDLLLNAGERSAQIAFGANAIQVENRTSALSSTVAIVNR